MRKLLSTAALALLLAGCGSPVQADQAATIEGTECASHCTAEMKAECAAEGKECTAEQKAECAAKAECTDAQKAECADKANSGT